MRFPVVPTVPTVRPVPTLSAVSASRPLAEDERIQVLARHTTQPPLLAGAQKAQKIWRVPTDPHKARYHGQGPALHIALDGRGCGERGCTLCPDNFVRISDGALTMATELTQQQAQRLRLLGTLDVIGESPSGRTGTAAVRTIHIDLRTDSPDRSPRVVGRNGAETAVYPLTNDQAHRVRVKDGHLFTRPMPRHR